MPTYAHKHLEIDSICLQYKFFLHLHKGSNGAVRGSIVLFCPIHSNNTLQWLVSSSRMYQIVVYLFVYVYDCLLQLGIRWVKMHSLNCDLFKCLQQVVCQAMPKASYKQSSTLFAHNVQKDWFSLNLNSYKRLHILWCLTNKPLIGMIERQKEVFLISFLKAPIFLTLFVSCLVSTEKNIFHRWESNLVYSD